MRVLVKEHGWYPDGFGYRFFEATKGDIYRDGWYADDNAEPVIPVAGDWVQAMYPNQSGGMDSSIRRALSSYGLTLGEQKYGYTREIVPL